MFTAAFRIVKLGLSAVSLGVTAYGIYQEFRKVTKKDQPPTGEDPRKPK